MDAHDVKKEVRRYITIFIVLMMLTVVTVLVSYLKVPLWVAICIALIIATFKGSLVACYFMHLISERKVIYLIMGMTVIFFLSVLLLPFAEHHSVPQGTVNLNLTYKPVVLDQEHHAPESHAEGQH